MHTKAFACTEGYCELTAAFCELTEGYCELTVAFCELTLGKKASYARRCFKARWCFKGRCFKARWCFKGRCFKGRCFRQALFLSFQDPFVRG